MYLRAVEIDGFKSFADRVEVRFDTGITSIVGPNGSGKSNILDAILWVLGEQSYKNIRAKESTDVIFSGGKNKKPKDIAEVSLYIDNSDGTLQIEVDEVKVTRRIKRSGENEYRINDKKVRLKDINELFLDTGVGKSAYSVIGQGKVERIISSSSKEIRDIIEEAAGTKKIKLRKNEATKKLEKVAEEVKKIDLILGEVKGNRDKLGKQSERASEYLWLTKERDRLSKGINIREVANINEVLKKSEERINILKADIESKKVEFEEAETHLEKLNTKRVETNEIITELTSKNSEVKDLMERVSNEKTMFIERKSSYNRELEERKLLLLDISEKIVEGEKELSENIEKIEEVKAFLEKEEKANLIFEEELKKIGSEIEKKEEEINHKREKLMTYEVERLRSINDIESSEKRKKSSENKIKELDEELKGLNLEIEVVKKDLETQRKIQEDLLKSKEEKERESEEIEKNLGEISKGISSIYNELREVDYNFNRLDGKLKSLKSQDASNEGFFKGVKSVLNGNIEGVEGALISLISIPERYEVAIEAAASGSMQDIVVKNSNVARKAIDHLKRTGGGKASFLAFDTIKKPKLQNIPSIPGVVGRGSSLVKTNGKYKDILEMVLGNILVVENMEIAIDISKKSLFYGNIVTLSGELISGRGRITGGARQKSTTSIIFERKKEIRNLEKEVKLLGDSQSALNSKNEKLTKEMERLEDILVSHDDKLEEESEKYKKVKVVVDDLDERFERLSKNIRIVDLESKEEMEYIKDYENLEKTSNKEKEVVEERMKSLKEEIERESNLLLDGRKDLESKKDSFSDKRIKYLNNKEKLHQSNLNSERIIEGIDTQKKRKDETIARVERLKEDLVKLDVKIEDLTKDYDQGERLFKEDYERIKTLKDEENYLEGEERRYIASVKEVEGEIALKGNKLTKELEDHEGMKVTKEKLSIIYEGLKSIEDWQEVEDIKEGKEKLKSMEKGIAALGIVNLLAIEEYEEARKKYEYISTQREDLLESEESLRGLIKEIEEMIVLKIQEAYKAIDKNFGYMCKEILNNSEGKLALLDKENILESGIELLVKFKNKKKQSITLLSGGEKSMVAVAFIMAIFMYKPSPFTFFDEIEAALDEMNTKRLIGKLKEFTDRSQFILITHNKETMRESDMLYGVTMNKEIGESKVLSVRM